MQDYEIHLQLTPAQNVCMHAQTLSCVWNDYRKKKLYMVKKEANKRRKSLDVLTQIECFQDVKYLGF